MGKPTEKGTKMTICPLSIQPKSPDFHLKYCIPRENAKNTTSGSTPRTRRRTQMKRGFPEIRRQILSLRFGEGAAA